MRAHECDQAPSCAGRAQASNACAVQICADERRSRVRCADSQPHSYALQVVLCDPSAQLRRMRTGTTNNEAGIRRNYVCHWSGCKPFLVCAWPVHHSRNLRTHVCFPASPLPPSVATLTILPIVHACALASSTGGFLVKNQSPAATTCSPTHLCWPALLLPPELSSSRPCCQSLTAAPTPGWSGRPAQTLTPRAECAHQTTAGAASKRDSGVRVGNVLRVLHCSRWLWASL